MAESQMQPTSGSALPGVRAHRALCCLAVLHAVLLLIALGPILSADGLPVRLWVGMVTLWFFWPLVLALHRNSSRRRAYVSVALAAVLLAFPMYAYQNFFAGPVFGPPEMSFFSPYYLADYGTAYVRGWMEGKRRRGADPIILESWGMGGDFTPGAPPFSDEARAKYHIKINSVGLCGVTAYILGHSRGFNTASVAEIKRRYGADIVRNAEREEAMRRQRYAMMKDAGRSEAENDFRTGHPAILIYRPPIPSEADYENFFRERFGLTLKRVPLPPEKIGSDDDAWAHLNGYNEAVQSELQRRFGNSAALAVMCVTQGDAFGSMQSMLDRDRAKPDR